MRSEGRSGSLFLVHEIVGIGVPLISISRCSLFPTPITEGCKRLLKTGGNSFSERKKSLYDVMAFLFGKLCTDCTHSGVETYCRRRGR